MAPIRGPRRRCISGSCLRPRPGSATPTNGNGHDNRVSGTQAFSGSLEPIVVSLRPKKRKLVAPETIAGGDAPEAVSRPNKRQRGPVAEGKARIIKRKYTVHVDEDGITLQYV